MDKVLIDVRDIKLQNFTFGCEFDDGLYGLALAAHPNLQALQEEVENALQGLTFSNEHEGRERAIEAFMYKMAWTVGDLVALVHALDRKLQEAGQYLAPAICAGLGIHPFDPEPKEPPAKKAHLKLVK